MVVLMVSQVDKVPDSHLILFLNYKYKLGKNKIPISVSIYLCLHREKKEEENRPKSYQCLFSFYFVCASLFSANHESALFCNQINKII